MAGGRPRYYTPPITTDWDDLDAEIVAFLSDFGKAPSTARNHAAGWATWAAHCRALGVDPMAAPFSAFEDLLLRRRKDGHLYARGTHDVVLAAVKAAYAEAGIVPAHKDASNAGTWTMLLKGAAREAGERKRAHPDSAEQWNVDPLLRDDLVAMLTAAPVMTPRLNSCVASVLLAIDGQLAARELACLEVDDITVLVDGGVGIGDQVFQCDHRERVRGVPWDCTACAVRTVVSEHAGTGPLLTATGEGDPVPEMSRRLARLRDRAWPGVPIDRGSSGWRSTKLTTGPNLPDWQTAGFRRACVLAVGRRGEAGTWLRARAWTAMAWSCGFRMCGDLLRLDRRTVSGDLGGAGYTIDLAGTKDDPYGEKRVVRPLPWGEGSVSVAGLLADYLCVRDAVHGADGHLLVSDVLGSRHGAGRGLADGGRGSGGGTARAKRDLALLCELAGLSDRCYSAKSTRKGFAEQAFKDGWDVENIRDALRHQTLGVTLNSYLAAATARDASTELIRHVGGDAR